MSVLDGIPDMGACSGIPDMGAWQFVIPDGLRVGKLQSRPKLTGQLESTIAGTAALNARIAVEGVFGADQS